MRMARLLKKYEGRDYDFEDFFTKEMSEELEEDEDMYSPEDEAFIKEWESI